MCFDEFTKVIVTIFSKSKFLKEYTINSFDNCIIYNIDNFEFVVSLDNYMEVSLNIREKFTARKITLEDVVCSLNFSKFNVDYRFSNQFNDLLKLTNFLDKELLIIDSVIEDLLRNPYLFGVCFDEKIANTKKKYKYEINKKYNRRLDMYWKEKQYDKFSDFHKRILLIQPNFQINTINAKRVVWIEKQNNHETIRQSGDGSMIDTKNQ